MECPAQTGVRLDALAGPYKSSLSDKRFSAGVPERAYRRNHGLSQAKA